MTKSIIKKSISRKIRTADFESIDIFVEMQEEIEWSDVREKMDKTKIISNALVLDFMSTLEKTMEELKLNKQISIIKKDKKIDKDFSSENPINKDKKIEKEVEKKEDSGEDFDFLSLFKKGDFSKWKKKMKTFLKK